MQTTATLAASVDATVTEIAALRGDLDEALEGRGVMRFVDWAARTGMSGCGRSPKAV